MATLIVNVQLFLLIAVVWILQTQIIYPIERTLLDPSWVEVASTLFLPAGFKVIVAVIMGWAWLLSRALELRDHHVDSTMVMNFMIISL